MIAAVSFQLSLFTSSSTLVFTIYTFFFWLHIWFFCYRHGHGVRLLAVRLLNNCLQFADFLLRGHTGLTIALQMHLLLFFRGTWSSMSGRLGWELYGKLSLRNLCWQTGYICSFYLCWQYQAIWPVNGRLWLVEGSVCPIYEVCTSQTVAFR